MINTTQQSNTAEFPSLDSLAVHLRGQFDKKVTLIFGHNGVGKTRLSMEFKELGKQGNATARDTLYFNAFTEDLFNWDNDLENNRKRILKMNTDSAFFSGIEKLNLEKRIKPILHCYCDFDFEISHEHGSILFWRDTEIIANGEDELIPIKVSRGEENLFIWSFFLALAQLAMEGEEAYDWVKYLYIDDPISSLDEDNAIAVAAQLAKLLKEQDRVKAVISSHHTLFYNVLCNEMKNSKKYYLDRKPSGGWLLHDIGDTPRFYHVARLVELDDAAQSGNLFKYHFTILRSIMEKTATFHGFDNFGDIVELDSEDNDGTPYLRHMQVSSHGNHSLFERDKMHEKEKDVFREILDNLMSNYRFNPELFTNADAEERSK